MIAPALLDNSVFSYAGVISKSQLRITSAVSQGSIPLAPLNPQTLFTGWIPTAMNSKTNRCVVQKPYSVPCMRRTIPEIGIVKAEDIAIGNVGLGITSKAIHQKPFNNVGVQDRRRIPSPIVNHAILRWGTVNGKRRSTVQRHQHHFRQSSKTTLRRWHQQRRNRTEGYREQLFHAASLVNLFCQCLEIAFNLVRNRSVSKRQNSRRRLLPQSTLCIQRIMCAKNSIRLKGRHGVNKDSLA